MDFGSMTKTLGDLEKMADEMGKQNPADLGKIIKKTVIEDIIVVNAGRKNKLSVPQGYEKVEGDLNEGAGGDYIYFCVKRGTNEENAINGLTVISGQNSKIAAPEGYHKINEDLNKGAGGRYIYLCIRRGSSNPIRDIAVVSGKSKNVAAPEGYTMIEQDLNEKAGGKYIYLCYK